MIRGNKVLLEAKSVSSIVSRHDPMNVKTIVKEQKITEISMIDFAKAIQDALKVNRAPQNTHTYPQREQQWFSI